VAWHELLVMTRMRSANGWIWLEAIAERLLNTF